MVALRVLFTARPIQYCSVSDESLNVKSRKYLSCQKISNLNNQPQNTATSLFLKIEWNRNVRTSPRVEYQFIFLKIRPEQIE